ncbi:galactosyltransferase-related protein [Helicobacter gastrocanis]|uniref:galactosyltransferase-related protein n=1 Tax=Helicobacter gastrocanis TaxID=2849641 RepID=UPI0021A70E7F|nr:galactosyltransferase-related protein [Helicobacter sp. NHP19-003]
MWQEDLGFRAAKNRNNAIQEATGEYIITIDTDIILSPMFIYDHLYFARPKVLLQGGRILLTPKESAKILRQQDFSLAYAKKSFKNRRILSLAKFIYKHRRVTQKIFQKHTMVVGVRSCNMSFSREDCLAIEGFNENFVGWGREDSEFVARFLFNHGVLKPLKFCALVYHLHHQENTRDLLPENHTLYLQTLKAQRIRWKDPSKSLYCPN